MTHGYEKMNHFIAYQVSVGLLRGCQPAVGPALPPQSPSISLKETQQNERREAAEAHSEVRQNSLRTAEPRYCSNISSKDTCADMPENNANVTLGCKLSAMSYFMPKQGKGARGRLQCSLYFPMRENHIWISLIDYMQWIMHLKCHYMEQFLLRKFYLAFKERMIEIRAIGG